MRTLSPTEYAKDLCYALQVLNEYEHLGLDEEYASKLRAILERQIGEVGDETVSCYPAQPIRFPVSAR
jgi:hypothetical protein